MSLYELANKYISEKSGVLFTSASLRVSRSGKLLCEVNLNAGSTSIYDIASLTKIVSTVNLLRLEFSGKINLDDKLSDVFIDKALKPETRKRFNTITVMQLLTHSSGIIAWFPFYSSDKDVWDVLEHIFHTSEIMAEPVYSDVNYIIVAEIIKHISDKSLEENLGELNQIIGSGMEYNPKSIEKCVPTEFGNKNEVLMCGERNITYHSFRSFDEQIKGAVHDGNSFYYFKGVSGHAGIFATTSDLEKVCRLYLDKGSINGKQIINPEIIEKSFSDYGGGRGIGLQVTETYAGGAGHTGFTGTSICIHPEENLSVVLFTNRVSVPSLPNIMEFRKGIHNLILDEIKKT